MDIRLGGLGSPTGDMLAFLEKKQSCKKEERVRSGLAIGHSGQMPAPPGSSREIRLKPLERWKKSGPGCSITLHGHESHLCPMKLPDLREGRGYKAGWQGKTVHCSDGHWRGFLAQGCTRCTDSMHLWGLRGGSGIHYGEQAYGFGTQPGGKRVGQHREAAGAAGAPRCRSGEDGREARACCTSVRRPGVAGTGDSARHREEGRQEDGRIGQGTAEVPAGCQGVQGASEPGAAANRWPGCSHGGHRSGPGSGRSTDGSGAAVAPGPAAAGGQLIGSGAGTGVHRIAGAVVPGPAAGRGEGGPRPRTGAGKLGRQGGAKLGIAEKSVGRKDGSRSATPTVLRRDQADGSRRQPDAPEPERVDGRSATPEPGTAGVSN
ncbi:Hypothetical predicted protein, partial [Pelobates cultripes]